jgi:hypothetical protein
MIIWVRFVVRCCIHWNGLPATEEGR